MILLEKTGLALSALVLCVFGMGSGFTAEPGKINCVSVPAPGIVTISAEGSAYDVPGGAKIGHLIAGTKYVRGGAVRHTDGETWILLVGPGGRHAGWTLWKAVAHSGSVFHCDGPFDLLYSKPR